MLKLNDLLQFMFEIEQYKRYIYLLIFYINNNKKHESV
jgi:hypothetical protein